MILRTFTEVPEGVSIRCFRPGDERDVWRLHLLAIAGSGGEAPDSFFSALRNVKHAFLDAGGDFLVAVSDGGIIAMGGFVPVGPQRVAIKGMRVRPEYRRRGIARQLLARLEGAAMRKGFTAVELETAAAQRAARKFYEACGYAGAGNAMCAGIEAVFYEKSLTRSRKIAEPRSGGSRFD